MFKSKKIKALRPASEVAVDEDTEFSLPWLKAPVLTGWSLRMFLSVLEGAVGGPIRRKLMRDNYIPQALEEVFIPEPPTYTPNTRGWERQQPDGSSSVLTLSAGTAPADAAAAAAGVLPAFASGEDGGSAGASKSGGSRVADLHAAYRGGRLTPSQVAERVISAVAASEAQSPPMRFFISHDPEHLRQQAAASSARWAAGKPLSVLDGVPFAVKDATDALPYPTTAGTAFMADWRTPTGTNPAVQALLDAGALLVGKTNLHEIGLGTTGLNLIHGTPRNPHSTAHHTGASSSGTAALLAAGVCPIAVGSDGGGSIRIPSSLCGLVGLKPTQDRVCTKHSAPIDCTVAVLGPMASTVQDCLLMYAVMANQGHNQAQLPPPLALPAALPDSAGGKPLQGKTAGVYWAWFEDAAPDVVAACRAALDVLQQAGMAVKAVRVPELDLLRAAHVCTIVSEMRNNMTAVFQNPATFSQFNLETRGSLDLGAGFEAAHYVQAQKIRTRTEIYFRHLFKGCDFLVTPTTPITAPRIKPAALRGGESDLGTATALMRYMLQANMLGLPAISVPVGTTTNPTSSDAAAVSTGRATSGPGAGPALPIGLQLMAPCWQEAELLRAAAVLEAGLGPAPRPPVWWDLLED